MAAADRIADLRCCAARRLPSSISAGLSPAAASCLLRDGLSASSRPTVGSSRSSAAPVRPSPPPTPALPARRRTDAAEPDHHIPTCAPTQRADPVGPKPPRGKSALEANAASTAAIILDGEVPAWLAKNGILAGSDRPRRRGNATTPGRTLEARGRNELPGASRATGIVHRAAGPPLSLVPGSRHPSGRRACRPASAPLTVTAMHRWLSPGW